jgi:signal transduction histidine kinase
VIRHAQASKVIVTLEQTEAFTRITVQDDGIGFDPKAIVPVVGRSGGFGLFSIEERMADLGGSVDIDSSPGRGCAITLAVPHKALS